MPWTVDAGTDAASIVCFDPGVLREVEYPDPELLEWLAEQGRLWFWTTSADGTYRIAVFVDEPVVDPFVEYLADPMVVEQFPVPTGALWICGAEYANRSPKPNALGTSIPIPAGSYHFTAWQVDDSYFEQLQSRKPGALIRILNAAGGVLGMAALACTVTLTIVLTKVSVADAPVREFAVATAILWVSTIASGYAMARLHGPAAKGSGSASVVLVLQSRSQVAT